MAPGIVAGSGDATAISAGTPTRDSTGGATDDPPTPKSPTSDPINAPAATTAPGTGVVATTTPGTCTQGSCRDDRPSLQSGIGRRRRTLHRTPDVADVEPPVLARRRRAPGF